MSDKNIHSGHRQRMLEKFERYGESVFLDHELLEMLLFFVFRQGNTNPIAHNLIESFDDIYGVFSANKAAYNNIDGIGDKSALYLELIRCCMNRFLKEQKENEEEELITVSKVSDSFEYCRKLFIGAEYEMLYMLCMDTKSRIRRHYLIGEGTLNQIPVYTRKVVQEAIDRSAYQVIIAHNHPKGKAEPSEGDINVTYAISHALATIDVPVVDHIIIGETDEFSFLRAGIMPKVQQTVKYSLQQREQLILNPLNPLSPKK